MKLKDILPIGTTLNFFDTGVIVKGYDQGCVILESLTGRGIKVVAAYTFFERYALKTAPFSDSYIPKESI